MEIPLYKHDYGIIKCRAEGWKSDYTKSRSLQSTVNYAYCIYCMCVNLVSEGKTDDKELFNNSKELENIYYNAGGIIRFLSSRAKEVYNAVGCYYAESLNFSSEKADYSEKLVILKKIEKLYKRHGKSVASSYAGVLESVISSSDKEKSVFYMNVLNKLRKNEDNEGVDFYYSSAIMKTAGYYSDEEILKYIEELKNIYLKRGESCKINYYFILSNYSYEKGFKEGEKALESLLNEYREKQDKDALGIYAFTMKNLICRVDIEEAFSLTEILGQVYKDSKEKEVAFEYVQSLFRITEEVGKPYIDDCINYIDEVYNEFKDDEIAYFYSRGLFNLFFETGSEKGIEILDKIYSLYCNTKDDRIAFEYAKGLFNTSAGVKDIELHRKALLKLENIFDETKNNDIMKEYLMGLLNSVYRGEKSSLDKLYNIKKICNEKFFENILKSAEKYNHIMENINKPSLCDINKTIPNIKYTVSLKDEGICYSFENSMDIFVYDMNDKDVNNIENIEGKAFYIEKWVSENIDTIKKLVFIDRYGYRFLDTDWSFENENISFGSISYNEASDWLTPVSVSVFCKEDEVYSFEVNFKENEKFDKDKLFGKGDWVRPENFGTESFYI